MGKKIGLARNCTLMMGWTGWDKGITKCVGSSCEGFEDQLTPLLTTIKEDHLQTTKSKQGTGNQSGFLGLFIMMQRKGIQIEVGPK